MEIDSYINTVGIWIDNDSCCKFKPSHFKHFILLAIDDKYTYYLGIHNDSETPDNNYILRSKVTS